jgi:hypothetical protein
MNRCYLQTALFVDMPECSNYEDAVVWAIENGTSKEMSATGFSLNLNSSCGWFVTFN